MADEYRLDEVFKAKMPAVAPRQSFSGVPKLSGRPKSGSNQMFTVLAQPAPIGNVRSTDVRHTSTAGKLCSELARGRGGDKRFCAWRSREVGFIRRATRSGRLYYRGRIAVPRCDAARSP